MKTNSLSLINLSLLVVAALAGSLLIARPVVLSRSAEAPIFVETELNVGNPTVVGNPTMVGKAGSVSRSLPISHSISLPQPVPLSPATSTPLPILPPRITCQVLPHYPALPLEQGLSGATLLSIFISKAGAPKKVEVKASSGITEFDESATKAVSQWQFEPARQGGAAVASWLEVPVRFTLN